MDTSGKVLVNANGDPAKIVAYGAAAGIVFVSVAIGYGTYVGIKKIGLIAKKK